MTWQDRLAMSLDTLRVVHLGDRIVGPSRSGEALYDEALRLGREAIDGARAAGVDDSAIQAVLDGWNATHLCGCVDCQRQRAETCGVPAG